MSPKL
jgi:hypothetical protein